MIDHLFTRAPWPHQRDGVERTIKVLSNGTNSVCLTAPTGCHARGQGILLHSGDIRAVEHIQVGELLMGPDSQPRRVLSLVRGEGELYRIMPTKGNPWAVNIDHILTLVRVADKSKHAGQIVDVSLREWFNWNKTNKHVHKLFRAPVDFPQQEHPGQRRLPFYDAPTLDPYLVGIVLGDGGLSCGSFALTTADREIVDYLKKLAAFHGLRICAEPAGGRSITYRIVDERGIPNPLYNLFRKYGIAKCNSATKFIPRAFKTGSRDDRLLLLAGLMDTDGSLAKGGYDYISKSRRLSDDIAFVARSVGLAAYVKKCEKRDQHGRGGDYWRVSISGNCSVVPCRIRRKHALPRQQKKSVCRTGFQVEYVGLGQYFGFSLSGDGRYLLDDFTVTHNSGKTNMQIALAKWGAEKNHKNVLCLTNRILLTDQTQRVFRDSDVPVGVISASMPHLERDELSVQIATIQTILARRRGNTNYWVNADLVLVDEVHQCFPSGTLIDGRPIETIRQGEAVRSLGPDGTIENRMVLRKFARIVDARMATVTLSDGIVVHCTSSHPVFVLECGAYIPAGWLKPGDEVYVDPQVSVCSVREGVYEQAEAGESGQNVLLRTLPKKSEPETAREDRNVRCVRKDLYDQVCQARPQSSLLAAMCGSIEDTRGHCPQREALVGANVSQEPDGAAGSSGESVTGTQGQRPQASGSGWQRTGHDEARAGNRQDIELATNHSQDAGMENGREDAQPLQDRHWQPCPEDCHRDRRFLPQHNRTTSTGPEKADVPRIARVVSVEIHESPSGGESRGLPKGRFVYNLEVEGNNNFFANGLLVHNCSTGESAALLDEYRSRGAKIIGVTATPLGVSNVCDELVVAGRTRDLQDRGILCFASWYAPSELDTRKLTKGKVDLSLTENAARRTWGPLKGNDQIRTRIVGNILEHYQRLHPAQIHTLAFAPGVKESLWAAQFCRGRGIRSLHVDAQDFWLDGEIHDREQEDQLFRQAIEQWRDGEIPILFNRFLYREGIDEPQIKCIMLATPIGSYRSFLQMVGRGLRTHESKEKCIVIDFGGAWWRFGSVNVNVDWESVYDCPDPDVLSKNRITKQRETGEPMGRVCPNCGMVHKALSRMLYCQYCGLKMPLGKPSRPIIQADGKLTQVTGEPISQWKIRRTPEAQKIWQGLYWNAVKKHNGEVSFNELYSRFGYKTAVLAGTKQRPAFWKMWYPPRDLPLMPQHPNDWHRQVAEVPKSALQ